MRRLPLYIIVETSTQMSDVIHLVNDSIQKLFGLLRSDPFCLETVFLSILSFDEKTVIHFPLNELYDVEIPKLIISKTDTANISECLYELKMQIGKEVVRTTAEQKGDWKPTIIFFTNNSLPTYNLGIETMSSYNPFNLKKNCIISFVKNKLNDLENTNEESIFVFQISNDIVSQLFNTDFFSHSYISLDQL
jgi:uncharacterized protein YegL